MIFVSISSFKKEVLTSVLLYSDSYIVIGRMITKNYLKVYAIVHFFVTKGGLICELEASSDVETLNFLTQI